MAGTTFSAPLAIIKVNGIPIGKMRDINIQENYQRIPIKGLGDLNPKEAPATNFAGTLSCGFYMVDLRESQIPGSLLREFENIEDFVNNVILESEGVSLVMYKKVKVNGQVELEQIATIDGLFIESDNFQLSEGQVAGKNQSFMYLNPIIIGK